jgi:hypothetical protein
MGIPAEAKSDSSCQEFQGPSTYVSVAVEVTSLYHADSIGICFCGSEIVISQYAVMQLELLKTEGKAT